MNASLLGLMLAHLRLCVISLACACVLGGLLGLSSLRSRSLGRLSLAAASLIQTVPTLALLAMMVPALALLGRFLSVPISGIGQLPALIGLTLYAVLPIARGFVLGVQGIEPGVQAASLAVGMTAGERLRMVELPLAAPSIIAGLRTATAWTVGMATLATPVGARSLGNLIFSGLSTRHFDRVALGCLLAAAMALVLDAVLAAGERRARRKPTLGLLAWGGAGFGALAVLASLQPTAAQTVRIGAKGFTEQLVLAQVLRCAVGDEAEADVRGSLGTTVAFDALRHGDLDMYVEYTGTAYQTLLHHTEPVGREAMRDAVARELEQRFKVHVVANLGFENAYALVVRGSDPAHTISDLGSARDRVFAGDYEFFERPEWRSLRERYGLAPRAKRLMDASLMYGALAHGAVDVISGYTTEGRIQTLGLRMLKDDRHAIPPYDAMVVVSDRLYRHYPEIVARLRKLDGSIDAATMRAWNAQVDAGRSPREAAAAHPACHRDAHPVR